MINFNMECNSFSTYFPFLIFVKAKKQLIHDHSQRNTWRWLHNRIVFKNFLLEIIYLKMTNFLANLLNLWRQNEHRNLIKSSHNCVRDCNKIKSVTHNNCTFSNISTSWTRLKAGYIGSAQISINTTDQYLRYLFQS